MTKANESLNHLNHLASKLLSEKLKGKNQLVMCNSFKCMVHINIIELGIISDRMGPSIVDKLFPHHVGHYLGLDVHDTMMMNRNISLVPNMVVTCEPGVYIPKNFPVDQPQKANEYEYCIV